MNLNERISMKYLLMLIAALALVGTATATSSRNYCDGSACCLAQASCCAE